MDYGATIERGVIIAAEADKYTVKSDTRYGIITPAIPYLGDGNLRTGDRVYFFMFEDGHGAILAAFPQATERT